MMRNILEVRHDPKLEAVEMGVAYDVKASPQVCVGIKTPDAEMLGRFVTENRETIVNLFLEGELRREAAMLRQKYSKLVDDASREIFGCTVKVPSDACGRCFARDFRLHGESAVRHREGEERGEFPLGLHRPCGERYELRVLHHSFDRQPGTARRPLGGFARFGHEAEHTGFHSRTMDGYGCGGDRHFGGNPYGEVGRWAHGV